MEQIFQVLRASIAPNAQTPRDSRTGELSVFSFRDRTVTVALVNEGHFLQLILETSRRKTIILFQNMTTPTNFEVIIFSRCLLAFEKKVHKKTLTVS